MKIRWSLGLFGFSVFFSILRTVSSEAGPFDGLLHAHGPHCTEALAQLHNSPRMRVQDGGQQAVDLSWLADASHEVYTKSLDLGYAIPPMLLVPVNGNDMSALIANVGHATPDWIGGRSIMQSVGRPAPLEFVEPGRESHIQFIREMNSQEQTIIVLSHVSGHYNYAEQSLLYKVREIDRVRDSYGLATTMKEAFAEHGHRPVTKFHQYLNSLSYLQDIDRGSFQHPSEFIAKAIPSLTRTSAHWANHDIAAELKSPLAVDIPQTNPASPTRSVLQAFVNNLPTTAPDWKRDMIRSFEAKERAIPAFILTKTANEGHASESELIVIPHTKFATGDRVIPFADTMLTDPNYQNPYWLGYEAWNRLRERFTERPDIKSLSPVEQDKAYLKYVNSIIKHHNTYSFIKLALDETWVQKQNYMMYRRATSTENPEEWWGKKKNICISRNAGRIIEYLATKVGRFDQMLPDIELLDLSSLSEGGAVLRHNASRGIPLNLMSAAKTLYVISKEILEKPVILETIASNAWLPEFQDLPRHIKFGAPSPWWGLPIIDPYAHYKKAYERGPLTTHKLKLRVEPSGKVSVSITLNENDKSPERARQWQEYLQALEKRFAAAIEWYRFSDSIGGKQVTLSPKMEHLISQIADHNAPATEASHVIGQAPTASAAIFYFKQFIKERMRTITKMIADGTMPIIPSKDGKSISVPAFPEIPTIQLDQSVQRYRKAILIPSDVETRASLDVFKSMFFGEPSSGSEEPDEPEDRNELMGDDAPIFGAPIKSVLDGETYGNQDEDLKLGRGPHQPGDMWDLPPKGQGGDPNGDPNDNGDDEDGDGDGDPDPNQPPPEGDEGKPGGDGGIDPDSMIRIPLEIFGQLLAEQIELRNLRRLQDGENPSEKFEAKGSKRFPDGTLRVKQTAVNAFKRGLAQVLADNPDEDITNLDPEDVLRRGLENLQKTDIVVADKIPVPDPDMDAVIVYVADTSGSMGPPQRQVQRNMVAFTSAVLKTIYPYLKERFVIYGDDAKEVDRDAFFVEFTNGGTESVAGLELGEEILEKDYPPNRFNRFMMLFSDGGDIGAQGVVERAVDISKKIEYFAYGHVDPHHFGLQPVSERMKAQAEKPESKDKFGFAFLDLSRESAINAIKNFFGKQK